jgi:hypothetical protein
MKGRINSKAARFQQIGIAAQQAILLRSQVILRVLSMREICPATASKLAITCMTVAKVPACLGSSRRIVKLGLGVKKLIECKDKFDFRSLASSHLLEK